MIVLMDGPFQCFEMITIIITRYYHSLSWISPYFTIIFGILLSPHPLTTTTLSLQFYLSTLLNGIVVTPIATTGQL